MTTACGVLPATSTQALDSDVHDRANMAGGPLAANALDCGRYSAPWRVITTGPHAEDLAQASIAALGFDAFLPKVAVPLKQHCVLRPLFPGYLFARIDTSAPGWSAVYRARGVEAVLTGPGSAMPGTLPDAALTAIRRHCDARQVVVADMRYDLIQAGVPVQITGGVLVDHRGVCLWSSKDRVRLMLDVMGVVVTVKRPLVAEVEAL